MRRLTVACKWKPPGAMQEPAILLKGEWLRNAGFESGDQILISVKKKKLVIDLETAYEAD